MCYVKSGTTLTLNCYYDDIHSCEEDGKSSLAGYEDWDTCYDDMDAVLDRYRDSGGDIRPGPNSDEAGGPGTSSKPGGGGSYDHTFTCPGGYGSSHTLPIPKGSCESQYEDYGEAFGCNLTERMYSTCTALYSCLGDQQNLNACRNYAGL